MNNGRCCDNCETHLNDEDYVSYGSWSYTCHECGFVYRHGLSVNEQVEKFNAAEQGFAPDAAPLEAPDDTTGAFDDSIIGSLP